jgi:serine/threonine-protein kinase
VKLLPGDLIDEKYRIVRILGTGGMGAVYEATNLRVNRRVAIKVLHTVHDEGSIARFEREARAAQIGSPYIVQVHDLGYLGDGAPYMVMEYLAGESLGERLQRTARMRPSEVLPIAKQVLEGLVAAHRVGIVHRDLKPDNVFLSRPEGEEREVVKLVDFGISKVLGNSSYYDQLSLTKSGCAVGTPQYMSPEQVQGKKELDTRSDVYSLGVMLYRCLSGHLPFNHSEIPALLMSILIDVPKPLREHVTGFDRELSAIVTRAMARNVDERYQTAGELLNALNAWERAHAPDLDVLSTDARMSITKTVTQSAIASSLSAVAGPSLSRRNRTLRLWALAVTFSFGGVVGLFVALKAWRETTLPSSEVTASAPASSVGTIGNAAQPQVRSVSSGSATAVVPAPSVPFVSVTASAPSPSPSTPVNQANSTKPRKASGPVDASNRHVLQEL